MPVSDHDREYFRRLAAIKARSHGDAGAAHRALPLAERLERSWALFVTHRHEHAQRDRDDDPSPFYERARELGLYRG